MSWFPPGLAPKHPRATQEAPEKAEEPEVAEPGAGGPGGSALFGFLCCILTRAVRTEPLFANSWVFRMKPLKVNFLQGCRKQLRFVFGSLVAPSQSSGSLAFQARV